MLFWQESPCCLWLQSGIPIGTGMNAAGIVPNALRAGRAAGKIRNETQGLSFTGQVKERFFLYWHYSNTLCCDKIETLQLGGKIALGR